MEDTLYNNIEAVLAENERRRTSLDGNRYNPLVGEGCWGDRLSVAGCMVPKVVLDRHPDYLSLSPVEQEKARIEEDFEFWCARCVKIHDKLKRCVVPFVLNRPQRRLLGVMEEQRAAGRPVRIILLKARQWGGSTLVQMYMAWMQLVRHKGWNSFIGGHLHVTSKSIKRMYNLLLAKYPSELLEDPEHPPRFTKLEGQPNVQQIEQRDCLVITGTARSEDSVRGYDLAMAHLSEVAFWKDSTMHDPDDVIRSVCGTINLDAETIVVLESTANGVGNFFHDEWLRACTGRSGTQPVFVPWYEIEMYEMPVDDASALWEQMDDYERNLWNEGRTLEQINWYHHKRREFPSHEKMMAEYPGTATEAFITTGSNPFASEHLDRLQQSCYAEPYLVGDIQAAAQEGRGAQKNIHLVTASNGLLKVWERPECHSPVKVRYMVVVDVGGRSDRSDYSVIAVWRMETPDRMAAIVAQWRGHIDHDKLAWKSMQLAKYYNDAMLVVESNTLTNEAARAGESDYILENVHRVYRNVYERTPGKLGFHTNVKTKGKAVTELIIALRDGTYVERDIDAVNEMRDYEERNGIYAARPGKHDDILMTRAIGLYVMHEPRIVKKNRTPPPDKSLVVNRWHATPV